MGCDLYNPIRNLIMANNPFNKQDIEKEIERLKELEEITKSINGNLGLWVKSYGQINKIQKELNKSQDTINKLKEEELNTTDQQRKLLLQGVIKELENEYSLVEEKLKLIKQERNLQRAIQGEIKKRTKETLESVGETTKQYVQQNFSVSSILSYLTDIDSQIRKTNLAIGGGEEGYNNIRISLEESAGFLSRIGVSLADAAQFQRIITEQTGRQQFLNRQNVESIALMVQGTGLQAEMIGEIVAGMELFGRGINSTKMFIEETLNMSNEMGLNGIAVTKKIGENLKKAQGFFFKQGQDKGLRNIVMLSEKYRMNIQSALGFAEKVQTVEGAVETAAQLQVLGGSFARLGNPFELLFKSRNDIEGFVESLVKTNDQIATFDKKSKTFKISALELQRLKSIAEVTSIPFEELTESALKFAQLSKASSQINFGTKKDREMIANMAKLNEKGGFDVTFEKGGEQVTRAIEQLTSADLGYLKQTQQSLKERAEQAMGFDDTLKSVTEELKATLLPLLKGINEALISFRSFRDSLFGEDGDSFAKKIMMGGLLIAGVAPVLLSFASVFLSGIGRLMAGGLLNKMGSASAMSTATTLGKGGIFSSLFGGLSVGKGIALIAGVSVAIIGLSYAFKSLGDVNWGNIDIGKLGGLMAGVVALGFAAAKLGVLISASGGGVFGIIAAGIGTLTLLSLPIFTFSYALNSLGDSFKNLSMGVNSIDTTKLKDVLSSMGDVLSQSTKSFGSAITESLFGNKIEGVVQPIVELSKIDSEKLKVISNLFAQSKGKPLVVKVTDDINIKFDDLKININGETSVVNNSKLRENIKEQVIQSLNDAFYTNRISVPSLNGRG